MRIIVVAAGQRGIDCELPCCIGGRELINAAVYQRRNSLSRRSMMGVQCTNRILEAALAIYLTPLSVHGTAITVVVALMHTTLMPIDTLCSRAFGERRCDGYQPKTHYHFNGG